MYGKISDLYPLRIPRNIIFFAFFNRQLREFYHRGAETPDICRRDV
ncbi:hypothetical protein SAMN04487894_115100 [Niabella drilacis]|uniref:Uncharacterized protein n=1 Tax=Niabella drilacis (strain DSM 25811 / CCM 8410 / CCUG 62505 / LMG 26954 / E90) TaxID=1285928 RepID=A0A1G6YH36_NIADE|nr:hypothetical protein SAMN04487894_115100 [Niabella drilacis]